MMMMMMMTTVMIFYDVVDVLMKVKAFFVLQVQSILCSLMVMIKCLFTYCGWIKYKKWLGPPKERIYKKSDDLKEKENKKKKKQKQLQNGETSQNLNGHKIKNSEKQTMSYISFVCSSQEYHLYFLCTGWTFLVNSVFGSKRLHKRKHTYMCVRCMRAWVRACVNVCGCYRAIILRS